MTSTTTPESVAALASTIVGKMVTFWVHMTDETYTGVVQEVVAINGEENILLIVQGAYRLFRIANIYGLEIITDSQDSQQHETNEPEQYDANEEGSRESDENYEDSNTSDTLDVEFVSDDLDYVHQSQHHELRQAVSILRNSILSETEDISSRIPFTTMMHDDTTGSVPDIETCPICLEEIDMSQNAVALSCCHKFHFDCIMRNMASTVSMQNNCPLCRTSIIQGFSVCSDNASVQQMYDRLLRENDHLGVEFERRRMMQGLLLIEQTAIEESQHRLLEARRLLEHTAFQILRRSANQTRLYANISHLVSSAANNNLRENYDELHEFYEEEIRNLCFNLGMHVLCGQYEHELDQPDAAADVQVVNEDAVLQGDQVNPIIVD
jgi:hypothetical protein